MTLPCIIHQSLTKEKGGDTEVYKLVFITELLILQSPAAAQYVQLSIVVVKLRHNKACAPAPKITVCPHHAMNSLLSCISGSVTLLWRLSEAIWSSVYDLAFSTYIAEKGAM